MTVRIGVSYLDERSGARYLDAIRLAGAEPVILATAETCPRWPSAEQAKTLFDSDYRPVRLVDEVDGLLLTGGGDVDPMLYHEAVDGSDEPNWPRDHVEMAQFQRARQRVLPILGICRGAQFLNVAMGGSLIQDLATAGLHRSDPDTSESRAHLVSIAADSFLARILLGESPDLVVGVNSRHHQGVSADRIAPGLLASAFSCAASTSGRPDVIEAIESPETRMGREFVLGVQWHPERLNDVVPGAPRQMATFPELSRRLFAAFVAAASGRTSGGK